MTQWLGIDPGAKGALAIVGKNNLDIEWIPLSETERDIWDWLSARARSIQRAYLEHVHSMPKQGVVSAFSFGVSFGFCRGLLISSAIPFETITPPVWQRRMGCRSRGNKNTTKAAAQELFPAIPITHINADALLLAECCRRDSP